jgi:hypothetical protein
MKWESKTPNGTIWQIDTDSILSGYGSVKCQSANDYFHLSYIEYIEMFGEDSHIWKASQKIESKKATFTNSLKTKKEDLWAVTDLDDKVAANCLTEGNIEVAGKNIKKPSVVSQTFTYLEYIEFFGEDEHVNLQIIHEKEFDL